MRIAICFCGQIRTGVESSPNLISFFGDLFPYCDFFIHTWNRNSYKPYNESRLCKKETILNKTTINKIKEIYSPKNFVIENYNETRVKASFNDTTDYEMFGNISPQWYSFMKSVEYKKEYEILNNFKYDYVVKLRPDIIFPLSRKLKYDIERYNDINKDDIYIENVNPSEISCKNSYIDDVYFIASSNTINVASLYYEETRKINGTYEYNFLFHLLSNNIIILDTPRKYDIIGNSSYSIYREECIFLSPLTQFNECYDCERYYFFNVNTKKSNKEHRYVEDLVKNHEIDENIFDINSNKLEKIYVDDLTFTITKNKIKFTI